MHHPSSGTRWEHGHKASQTRRRRRAGVLWWLFAAPLLASCGAAPSSELPESALRSTDGMALTWRGEPLNGVIMQAFYEGVPITTPGVGSWWNNLRAHAQDWAAMGITAVWIPPPYKGARCEHERSIDNGYGVYDRYDLGEFNEPCGVRTRYGTRQELQAAVRALHEHRIQVYGDMVMNHLTGADATEPATTMDGRRIQAYTHFLYPERAGRYSSFEWRSDKFSAIDQGGWQRFQFWDFEPYADGQAADGLLGAEVHYRDDDNRQETLQWSRWLTSTLGLDGYRIDAAKHIWTDFINQWLAEVPEGRFTMSEAWFTNLAHLQAYAEATHRRTSLFDVPLHYLFYDMSLGNGAFDMRALKFAGFTEVDGPLSVSFVENHDTDHGGGLASPVTRMKELAYAYILTRRGGYPCIYVRDVEEYGLGDRIRTLLQIRRANAWGDAFEYAESDQDVYLYRRNGDSNHHGLLLMLNDGPQVAERNILTTFPYATLRDRTGNMAGEVRTDGDGRGAFRVPARGYAVWVPD